MLDEDRLRSPDWLVKVRKEVGDILRSPDTETGKEEALMSIIIRERGDMLRECEFDFGVTLPDAPDERE